MKFLFRKLKNNKRLKFINYYDVKDSTKAAELIMADIQRDIDKRHEPKDLIVLEDSSTITNGKSTYLLF